MQYQLHDLDARLFVLRKTAAAAKEDFEQANVSTALYVSLNQAC
jgi:hypothetical protein